MRHETTGKDGDWKRVRGDKDVVNVKYDNTGIDFSADKECFGIGPGYFKLRNVATASLPAAPDEGAFVYDSTLKAPVFYNGTDYKAVSALGSEIALADIEDITTDRLLGRDTAGSGAVEQLTVGGGLGFTGSGGIEIADSSVTSAKMGLDAGLTVAGGDVTMDAAQGLDFSANTGTAATGASTTAEVLDHYEEGTWTPVINTDQGQTYFTQVGRFRRIGGLVWIVCALRINSLGSLSTSAAVYIRGLPYTPVDATSGMSGTASVGFADSLNLGAAGQVVSAIFNGAQTGIQLYVWDATSGTNFLTVSEFSSSGRIMLSGAYLA